MLLIVGPNLMGQQPAFRHLSLEDGLPSNEVYHILRDSKGYLWFSTDRGVSRFNGSEFQNFTSDDGLPDNTVFHTYEDKKGRVWFLTYSPLLSYFWKDTLHTYAFNDQIAEAEMPRTVKLSMVVDSAEGVTVGTIKGGWYHIDRVGNLFRSPAGNAGELVKIEDEVVLSNNRLDWGGNPQIEYRTQSDSMIWSFPISTMGSFEGRNYAYLPNPQEAWFTFGNYLIHHQSGQPEEVHFSDRSIDCIFGREDEVLWLGYNKGGARAYQLPLEENTVLHDLLPGLTVTHITEDHEHGMWFSTVEDGVFFSSAIGALVEFEESLPAKRIMDISLGDADDVYLSYIDGTVWHLGANGQVQRVPIDPLPVYKHRCEVLFEASTGELWTSAKMSSLGLRNKEELERFFPKGLPRRPNIFVGELHPNKLMPSRKGGFWLASRMGLFRYDQYEFQEGLQPDIGIPVDELYEAKDGSIWVGDRKGLHVYADGAWRHWGEENALGKNRFDAITELPDGSMVLACRGTGLVWWQGEKISLISEEDGLSSLLINDLVTSANGSVWVATEKGINQVWLREGQAPFVQHISAADGLPSNHISRLELQGDRLWVGTHKGLCLLYPDRLPPNPEPPLLQLTGMRINGVDTALQTTYRLKSKQNYLTFTYAGISYRSGGGITYDYKLEGLDPAWQRTTEREARYNALPPGVYTFLVRAANVDGVCSETAAIELEILPPFWQRTWFMLVTGGGLLLIGGGVFFQREKRNREKAERERRTAELELTSLRAQMNPHFTFNTLNSIQHFIAREDSIAANIHLAKFARLIRKTLENSRHNRIPLQEEIETLELYLKLEKLRFKGKLEYQLEVDPESDPEGDLIPPMLIQPFVENAIVHGIQHKQGQGRVKVKLIREPFHLKCIVEDNGIGRAAARVINEKMMGRAASRGISITQERLDLMNLTLRKGWSLKVEDLKNTQNQPDGTRVELIIPL